MNAAPNPPHTTVSSSVASASAWSKTLVDTAIEPKGAPFELNRSLHLLFRRRSWGSSSYWSGWMPTSWLRLRAASISGWHGTEVGATLIMFQPPITPTVTVEAGHYCGGDAFSKSRGLSRSPHLDPSLQRSFNSDYQTGYFGVELGAGRIAISINAGLTRAQNSNQRIQSALEASPSKPVASVEDIRTGQIGPAAKVALVINL